MQGLSNSTAIRKKASPIHLTKFNICKYMEPTRTNQRSLTLDGTPAILKSNNRKGFSLESIRNSLQGVIMDNGSKPFPKSCIIIKEKSTPKIDKSPTSGHQNEIIISKWFGSCPNLECPEEFGSDNQASIIEEEEGIFTIFGNFKDFYTEKKTLGQGMSAVVKLCISVKTQLSFAVKIVDTKGDDELEDMLKKEFRFRKNLSHRNIVKVYELYVDRVKGKIYTVMELAEGREMFDVIRSIGQYNENIASNLFKQLLLAIQFLHKNGVVHRDLKPHNIIVSPDGSVLKLTDFNVSKFYDMSTTKYSAMSKQNMKMWTYTGTVAFLAPEVLEDLEYTEAVDLWGAGIVLFMMLSGYHPFKSEEMDDIIEEIKLAKIEFKEEDWETISLEARDLVKNLLAKDPNVRYSPFQALTHPWVVNQGSISSKSIPRTRENLDRYYDLKKELAEKNTPYSELIKRRELNKDGSPLKYFKLCKAYTGEIAGSLL